MKKKTSRRPRGFGLITVAVVLVILSLLAAAAVRLLGAAQQSVNGELQAARAEQAARAGTQWGMYQALKGSWVVCSNSVQQMDFSADYGLHATVSCNSATYNDGLDPSDPSKPLIVHIYTITAVACSASSCPDDARAQQANYVERSVTVQLTN